MLINRSIFAAALIICATATQANTVTAVTVATAPEDSTAQRLAATVRNVNPTATSVHVLANGTRVYRSSLAHGNASTFRLDKNGGYRFMCEDDVVIDGQFNRVVDPRNLDK
jgi:hypothetical protein